MVLIQDTSFHRSYFINKSSNSIASVNTDKYELIFQFNKKFPMKMETKYSYFKMQLPQELVPNTNHISKQLKEFMDYIIKTFEMTYYKLRILKLNSQSNCYYLEVYYTDRQVINDFVYSNVDKFFSKKTHKSVKKYRYNPKLHYIIKAGEPLNGQKMVKKWSKSPSRNSRIYFIKKLQERSKKIYLRLNLILKRMNVKRFFIFYTNWAYEGFKSMETVRVRIKNKVTDLWENKISSSRVKTNDWRERENRILLAQRVRKYNNIESYIGYLLVKYYRYII